MSNVKFGLQLELQGEQLVVRGLKNVRSEVEKVGGQVGNSTSEVNKASAANRQFAESFGSVRAMAGAVGGVLAALGIGKIAGELISVNREAQTLRASLATVTGSVEAGNAAWREMEAFARTTPFALDQSVNAFVKMKALGLDPTTSALTSFGNTASAMGKDLTQMIEAVADASTGEFERLKEFGIKANQEGDRVKLTFQGVTTEIGNNSAEIVQYLEKIGNTEFAGAMERQMDTLGGAASNLSDNIDGLMRAIGEAGTNDSLAGAINSTSGLIAAFTLEVNAISEAVLQSGESAGAAATDYQWLHDVLGDIINVAIITKNEFTGLGDLLTYWSERIELVAKRDRARILWRFNEAQAIEDQILALDQQRAEKREALENRISDTLAKRESASKRLQEQMALEARVSTAAKLEIDKLIQSADLFAVGQAKAAESSESLDDQLAALIESSDLFALSQKDVIGYLEAQSKAAKALADEQQRLLDSLFPVEAKHTEILDQLKLLDQWYASNKDQVDKYREAKAKLQQQLQALNAPHQQTIAALQLETEWLQRELAATVAGEDALRAFNREKAIELELRRHNVDAGSEEEAQLRREIAARYDASQALTDYRDTTEEARRAQEEANRVTEQFITEIVGNFASGVDDIGDYFSNLWTRIKQEFINSGVASLFNLQSPNTPLLSGLGQLFGLGGGGGAGSAGGGGGLGNMLSLVSSGRSLWSGASALFGGTDSLMVPAHMLTREAAQQTAALTNSVNTWGPILAGIGGAIQGWQSGNKLNAATGALGGWGGAKAGAAAGTYILPGIGTAIGAIIGGILGSSLGSKVFGGEYETTRGGIQLGFDAEGFAPQAWERQTKAGGMFGSTKRRYRFGDLDPELDAMLTSAYDAAVMGIGELYAQVGIAVEDGALESVQTAMLRIGTSGKSEQTQEEIEAQIAAWFDELTLAMVQSIDGSLDTETLTNLASSLTGVNALFSAMHLTTYDLSIAGAELAARLVDMAGGMELLASASDFYYQNFYSEEERAQHRLDEYSRIIGEFNEQFGTAIQGKDDLRAFVDQLHATGAMATEAGMEMYLAALNLAPALVGAADAMAILAAAAEQVPPAQPVLSAGQINTITDIAGTALAGYNQALADRAGLERQLADVQAEIAEVMARMASSGDDVADAVGGIPAVIDGISGSVDSLTRSSSQLRGFAANLLGLVGQLTLSDISPLSHRERLMFAQAEYARAQVQAEAGDPSALAAAAQAYLRENANYYANNDTGVANFNEVVSYLSEMGVSLDGQADKAELAERARERQAEEQRQATEALRAAQQVAAEQAREDAQRAREQAQLDLLLQEQQRLELALQSTYAVDAEAILDAQLQALIDTSAGIDTLAGLLAVLPRDLAAALGNVVGVQPQDYGSPINIVERLYQEVLGRSGDAAGMAYWQAYQQSAGSIDQLVSAFFRNAVASGETPRLTESQFMASYDVGTPYVTHDQVAQIHRGEIILDPQSSDILRRYGIPAGNNAETLALLRSIDARLQSLGKTARDGFSREAEQMAEQNRLLGKVATSKPAQPVKVPV